MAGSSLAERISISLLMAATCVPGATAGVSSLADEVLARVNDERAGRASEPMAWSTALERAALAQAEALEEEAARFPSARPEHITALAALDQLPRHLETAGYSARRASAHVVVADRPLAAASLLEDEPGLWEDLLDPNLREVGLARVRRGDLEILVAIVGLSKAIDFATLTVGLEDRQRVRADLLRVTNEARRARQRRPLRRDRCLERVAQRYADRMLADGFYGHHSPEGRDVAYRVRGGGCPRAHVGENLARGQTSVEQVIGGWMESPDHRQNLLQPDFRRVGFGLGLGRRGDEYWILWVQVLSGE